MPRQRLCKVCGGWHDLDKPWPHNCVTHERPMQHLAAPRHISDGMSAVQSMTNGLWYDSKSALRSEYKRAGVTEVGNEKLTPPKPDKAKAKKDRQATIGKALSRAGFGAP